MSIWERIVGWFKKKKTKPIIINESESIIVDATPVESTETVEDIEINTENTEILEDVEITWKN